MEINEITLEYSDLPASHAILQIGGGGLFHDPEDNTRYIWVKQSRNGMYRLFKRISPELQPAGATL